MMLTHGSHLDNLNTEGTIKKNGGRFGSVLFFTTAKNAPYGDHAYRLDASELNIARTFDVAYTTEWDAISHIVEEYAELIETDVETAFDVIVEHKNGWDIVEDFDGHKSWAQQRALADCAIALGYDGVQCFDENGTVYMINMLGRETMIVPATDDNWY